MPEPTRPCCACKLGFPILCTNSLRDSIVNWCSHTEYSHFHDKKAYLMPRSNTAPNTKDDTEAQAAAQVTISKEEQSSLTQQPSRLFEGISPAPALLQGLEILQDCETVKSMMVVQRRSRTSEQIDLRCECDPGHVSE